MTLLDPKNWQSRPLSGPEYPVTEPATGDTLGTVTLAAAEDIRPAVEASPHCTSRVGAGPALRPRRGTAQGR